MKKGKKLYEGKAKIIYATNDKNLVIQYFKDDATAFNNQKKTTIEGKGVLNNRISEYILSNLSQIGIKNHLVKRLNMREQIIKLVEIIPIEFIVRNVATGSITKRLGIEDGTVLKEPLIEYCLKDDKLGDPLIAEEHILAFDWASKKEIEKVKKMILRINDFMIGMFRGKINGQILRLALMSAHYKQPLDWNDKLLDECKNTIEKWYNIYLPLKNPSKIPDDMLLPLYDDLNTPGYIANLHKLFDKANEGNEVFISKSDDPKRKLKYTLEIIKVKKNLVGVNTHFANKIAHHGLSNNLISELKNNKNIKPEVFFNKETRFDFFLENKKQKIFVEVKNVTLFRDEKIAEFPDAITSRGSKHLQTLIDAIKKGYKTYLLFLIQIEGVENFKIAKDIDKEYYENYLLAKKAGVNFLAYRCKINSKEIKIEKKIKIINE